jgi:hypothetical protein
MNFLCISCRSGKCRGRGGPVLSSKALLRVLPSKVAIVIGTSSGRLASCGSGRLCLVVRGAQSGQY